MLQLNLHTIMTDIRSSMHLGKCLLLCQLVDRFVRTSHCAVIVTQVLWNSICDAGKLIKTTVYARIPER